MGIFSRKTKATDAKADAERDAAEAKLMGHLLGTSPDPPMAAADVVGRSPEVNALAQERGIHAMDLGWLVGVTINSMIDFNVKRFPDADPSALRVDFARQLERNPAAVVSAMREYLAIKDAEGGLPDGSSPFPN